MDKILCISDNFVVKDGMYVPPSLDSPKALSYTKQRKGEKVVVTTLDPFKAPVGVPLPTFQVESPASDLARRTRNHNLLTCFA
jgi:hypothetical protein